MNLRALRIVCILAICGVPLAAQLPFYTDDPAVTPEGTFHFEFFNEYDALQNAQFPNLRQNTVNYKLNFGLPHHLEIDLDSPYLSIFRAFGNNPQTSTGVGDTNLGLKWNFYKLLSASFYVEFPTGDERQELGSGLIDYWLNLIAQKAFAEGRTRLTVNTGMVFTGNTSTGVLGIETNRGHVYTAGLSLLHDFTPRLTLGAELYGGFSPAHELGRSQLQVLAGGQYQIRNGLTFNFGLLGGRYVASPRIGAQLGFSVDFPVFRKNVRAAAVSRLF